MKFDFTLDNFMNNVSGKSIKIEATNTDGKFGLIIKTIITDASLEYIEDWDRYELTINDNNIKLIFDKYNVSQADFCQNVLALSRSGEDFVYVSLPIGDSWLDEDDNNDGTSINETTINLNTKIKKCNDCIFDPSDGCKINSYEINECEKFIRAW